MVFASLSLEQGLQISISVWNRVNVLSCDSGVWSGYYFAARIALQMNVVAVPTPVSLHVYSKTPSPFRRRTAFFSLEQGINFHDFVCNRFAKLCLFSLEQFQVPRHSGTPPS